MSPDPHGESAVSGGSRLQTWLEKETTASSPPGVWEEGHPILLPHCIPQGPQQGEQEGPRWLLLPPTCPWASEDEGAGVAGSPGPKIELLCQKEKDFIFWVLKAGRKDHAETNSGREPLVHQGRRNNRKCHSSRSQECNPGGHGTLGVSGHWAPRCHVCCSTPHLLSLQGAAALLRRKQALGLTAQRHRTHSSWSVYRLGLGMIHWPGLKTRKSPGEQSCGPSGLRSPGVTAQRPSKLRPSDPEEADPKSLPSIPCPLGMLTS